VDPGLRFSANDRDIRENDDIELTSVGVDIGSTTSHLIFSRLALKREGQRWVVVDRSILHRSDMMLTPYVRATSIDALALGGFIDNEYRAAGLLREQIDAGAVILTGIALLAENARAVADLFAREGGRLVAVSAGDRLEAMLAAHGSGAVAASADGRRAVLNVDIGGGTTKLAFCRAGRVESAAAMDIGARLVVLRPDGTVLRLEAAAREASRKLGLGLLEGAAPRAGALERLADFFADRLFEVIRREQLQPETRALLRTPDLTVGTVADALTLSGGVAEYISGHETRTFGDLGALLAARVDARARALGWERLDPATPIRATAIGAAQHTVQVSGNTIFVSSPGLLPLRNVPVARPQLGLTSAETDAVRIGSAVTDALDRADLASRDGPVAIAVEWHGSATYERLDAVARGLLAGLRPLTDRGAPVVLACDSDIGGLLGLHIREHLAAPGGIVSIDGVDLREFDYIDIGSPLASSGAVALIVKSLVFASIRGGAGRSVP
jgi:ethanolamine utilization protein EutA